MIGDVRGRALLGRALLRHGEGRRREALLDLQQSVELDSNPVALQTLAGWYAQSHNWPAALAVWRRLARLHFDGADRAALREAEISVAALSLLCAEADPVVNVPESAGWVRRALAHMARKRPSKSAQP